jgi:hypothetical protein
MDYKVGDKVIILCDHVPGRPGLSIPMNTVAIITEIGFPIWSTIMQYRLMYDGHKNTPSDDNMYINGYWFRFEEISRNMRPIMNDPDFSLEEIEEAEAIVNAAADH